MSLAVDRGVGATSRQIQAAPAGATFIWCNDQPGYARDLARHLGRADLDVVPASTLEFGGFALAGARGPIVVDHALVAGPRHAAGLRVVDLLNGRAAAK